MAEYNRWLEKWMHTALQTRRVVIISGARQVGKSTLTRALSLSHATYRTLDDVNMLKSALDDPKSFLMHTQSIMVVDEIQKAPLLLPEIKIVVDNNPAKGQFLLTGSADVQQLPEVNESLAGRVKNIRLRALTQGEILGIAPHFLQKAFAGDFSSTIKGYGKQEVVDIALRGGYPEAVALPRKARKDFYKDYIKSILHKDLKDMVNIKRSDVLGKLMKIMASWSSKYMDLNGVCGALGLSQPTARSYMSWIEKMFIAESLPPWIQSDYDRVGRRDKFFMADTGLMSAILNWHYDDVIFDGDKSGKLVETMVFHELSAQLDLGYDYSLYHYRDRLNREIDFIVENENEELLGIEVKSGAKIDKNDFKHLKWFQENMTSGKKFTGIVLYAGEDTLFFAENMVAVPLAMLWQ